jgi:hypothetical protein
MMSFTVVIKGPVARAGSILYRSSIKGTKVPNKAANMITQIKEMLTVMHSDVPNPSIRLELRIRMPQINPLMIPTPNSFESRANIF